MRLIWCVDGAHSGAENMRRDRVLLARSEREPLADPVLRVYGWSPPAVSLGYHQNESPLDPLALRARGIEQVRRPTGGAAVLHDQEITYAVAGPLGLPGLGRGVLAIHDGIAAALRATLVQLGVPASTGGGGRPDDFACFASAGGHEITVDGRKLVGSALRRGRRAFLQHGSVLVGEAHLELPRLLKARDDADAAVERLRARTCTLRELGVEHLDAVSFGREFAARLAHAIGAQAHRVEDPTVFRIPESSSVAASEAESDPGGERDALR